MLQKSWGSPSQLMVSPSFMYLVEQESYHQGQHQVGSKFGECLRQEYLQVIVLLLPDQTLS